MAKTAKKTTKKPVAKKLVQRDYILIDRSGSMGSIWTEALGSVNQYVRDIAKNKKIDTLVTVAVFDGNAPFEVIRQDVAPRDWKDVTNADASPRGMTPLADAVGRLVALADTAKADKVAVIVMTDGHENASREFTMAKAKELIEARQKKGWGIVFLGANFDNTQQAASLGVTGANTAYTTSPRGLVAAMSMMSMSREVYNDVNTGFSFTKSQQEKIKTA